MELGCHFLKECDMFQIIHVFCDDDDDDDDMLWILIMYVCNTPLCCTISDILHCIVPVYVKLTTSPELEHGLYLVAPVIWMYACCRDPLP